jgi:putative component of membrane protein insertase Oxa1/YidC/SpoIIIJ protein YidD
MEFHSDPGTHHIHSGYCRMLWARRYARTYFQHVGTHLPKTMRRLILFAVELYWRLRSPAGRKTCLFRESCSHHVHRITNESGALKGLIAFALRFRRCRAGYAVEFDDRGEPFFRLSDRSIAPVAELSESMAALAERSRFLVRGPVVSSGMNLPLTIAGTRR